MGTSLPLSLEPPPLRHAESLPALRVPGKSVTEGWLWRVGAASSHSRARGIPDVGWFTLNPYEVQVLSVHDASAGVYPKVTCASLLNSSAHIPLARGFSVLRVYTALSVRLWHFRAAAAD